MRGIGAGVRIFEVLDRSPAVPHGIGEEVPKGQLGVVKFEHVHFEYPSRKGVEILKDFNLELGIGESVVIVYGFLLLGRDYMRLIFSDSGASGGGKSSVHSLLLRYYDPIHGKITFDGKGLIPSLSQREVSYFWYHFIDIREFSTTSWRQIIGVVPQDPVLFTGTVASNIAFGNQDVTREEIENAARQANCEFIWGMPNGFDTESQHFYFCFTDRWVAHARN